MPIKNISSLSTELNDFELAAINLNNALHTFAGHYGYASASPGGSSTPASIPELNALLTEVCAIATEISSNIKGPGSSYTYAGVESIAKRIDQLKKDMHKHAPLMVGRGAEWAAIENKELLQLLNTSDKFHAGACGVVAKRISRKACDLVGLNGPRRQAVRTHLKRNKGKYFTGAAAGAVLWSALQVDGCSINRGGMPPVDTKKGGETEKFHSINKRESAGGKEYDGDGEKFSVNGFLNASMTTFGNGASPEAQAFQGVWNYITEHRDDQVWLGERYHFHWPENDNMENQTHYDINAYTNSEDKSKTIEFTWNIPVDSSPTDASGLTRTNAGTWSMILNMNGTIDIIHKYHDGRPNFRESGLSKQRFQEILRQIRMP